MKKRILLTIGLGLLLVVVIAGAALAQGATPPAKADKATAGLVGKVAALGRWAGVPKGNWDVFDAMAKALKLTPTQLFEQLHGGKTLQEIAKAQGVDIKTVTDAVKSVRADAAKASIEKAVAGGRISRAQADWMLKGLENGWRWPPRLKLPRFRR